ncbi:hypothetical protein AJ80_01099 [Polytolypa hystricis UAMH7299]|uniref:Methyltransferase domain-containing protein n=1 Tax=Polytolypa hystricis (strain UAMH7299) TaxID=1447883 RepID=A0A2B7Z1N0_POLH7|nr:hypothetical protein AJ80_01099 [Polytolypa hystricis UAMH7299]
MALHQKRYSSQYVDDECQRMTLQHRWIKYNMKGLIFAPIDCAKPNMRVLESATGNAVWLRDIMLELPRSTTFVGTDYTSEWFPRDLPKSISLSIQSIKEPWLAEWVSSFDFVYQRLALSSCSRELAKAAVFNLFDLVKPGGWIQLVECDNCALFGPDEISKQPAISRFTTLISRCFALVGQYELHHAHRLQDWLAEAGAKEVHSTVVEIPVGCESLNPELGIITSVNIVTILRRLKDLLVGQDIPGLPSTLEEFDEIERGVLYVLDNLGATQAVRVVYARK